MIVIMDYEVVIVGAGPSGATAAKTLAEQSISVLLLDKDFFPRDKPCGGGLPLRTLSRFHYIKDGPAIESYTYGGTVYSPSLTYQTLIKKTEPVIAMIVRSKFDHELVQLSIDKGATFRDNTRVTDIKIHKDHALVHLNNGSSITTELIIGADGFHSTVAQKTGLIPIKRNKGICILKEFQLEKEVINELYTTDHLCHIHSKFQGIKGYGWVFPKQNHVNVGIVSYDTREEREQKQINIRKIFSDYLNQLSKKKIIPSHITIDHAKGGVLPVQPLPKTYASRVLLCGDAAGLINPISGEGIYYALVSGELAGYVASDSIRKKDTTEPFLSTYEKRWKQDFGKEIKLFLRSKKQWGKKGDTTIRLMNKDPLFAELVFSIMVGKESVYDLRWKLIKRYLYNAIFRGRR